MLNRLATLLSWLILAPVLAGAVVLTTVIVALFAPFAIFIGAVVIALIIVALSE